MNVSYKIKKHFEIIDLKKRTLGLIKFLLVLLKKSIEALDELQDPWSSKW